MAEETSVETKLCKNCKRDISVANFVMHEIHCMRNIALCKHCKEPIPKGEMDQHFQETHAKIACSKCGLQVEKNLLEKHEQDECTKRPMKCLYCELEMPKSELDSHLGYCGTRTETCHKCGQFIMKKDEIKHDESNCTYPTQKPTTDNGSNRNPSNGFAINSIPGGSSVLLPDELYHMEPSYDPFTFEEMHRLLRSEDMSGAAGGTSNPIINDTRRDKMKFTKSKTNKKSEVNKQREKTNQRKDTGISASQEEHDRLLAMHLAQGLSEEDRLQNIMQQLDKPSLVQRGGQPSYMVDRNVKDSYDIEPDLADISLLPCEFCGEAIPIDNLVNHQSHCTDDPLSSLMPHVNNQDNSAWSSGRIAQESLVHSTDNRYRQQESTRQQPSVINNLDFGVVQNLWADDSENVDIHGPDSGNFMLPCEFCDELFPQDVLVQHQAVCEPSSMTPRAASPAARRQPKKQNVETSSSFMSDRHKPPPNVNDILQNRPTPNSRTSSSASKDEPPSKHLRETLHKYGVDLKEPKVPQTRRYSSTHDSDEENVATPRRLSQPKRTDSAARTKNTLENLLHGEPTPEFDFLGHLNGINGSKKKQSKDNINVSRQNYSPGYTPTVSGARGDVKTNKTTTAGRQLRQEQEVPSSFMEPRANRNSSRNQGSTPVSSSRSRPQGDITPSRSTGLDTPGNRRTRTTPFDYGTNKTKPSSRRHQDQL